MVVVIGKKIDKGNKLTSKVIAHCPPQKEYRLKVETNGHVLYIEPGQLGDFHIWGGNNITISEEPIAYAYPAYPDENLGS
jgi:hypothetical protein